MDDRGAEGPGAARTGSAPQARLLAGIGLVSFCLLALEICLTRLFGWLLRYHFAFFAISLALCGLGLGGYAAHLVLRRRRLPEEHLLLVACYGVAVSTLVTLVLALLVVIPSLPTSYALVGALLMLPFFFGGMALALLFRRHAHAIGALYASDLLGAALAAPGAVLLLNLLGPVGSMLLIAAAAACVPLMMTRPARRRALASAALVAASLGILLANHRRPFLDLPITGRSLARVSEILAEEKEFKARTGRPPERSTGEVLKRLIVHLAEAKGAARVVHTEWNAFGRTDVEQVDAEPYWLKLWLDGDVPTPLMRFDGHYEKLMYLLRHPASVPYRLRPVRSVLSLGSGGGIDVLMAKMRDAESVDAVEVNPSVPAIMDRPEFREFHGGVYDLPGVRFYLTEGRSFVKRTRTRYDLITLSLTQAFTTGHVGVALMESYIHTLEACQDYYRSLTDGGMVMLLSADRTGILPVRWFLTCLEAVARETNEAPGEALQHLMLLESPPGWSPYDYVVLTSRKAFSQEEVERALALRADMGPYEYTFLPGRESAMGRAIREQGWRGLAEATRLTIPKVAPGLGPPNVAPATDESPFFFDVSFGVPDPLRRLLQFGLLLTAVFLVTAGVATVRRAGRADSAAGDPAGSGAAGARDDLRSLLLFTFHFSCLGVGFMLIEVGLIQRLMILLGSPTHTVALILFAVLLGSAAGSARSGRGDRARRLIGRAPSCAAVGCAAVLVGLALPSLAEVLLSTSYPVRLVSGFALCAGIGIFMGVPFPSGVRAAAQWREDAVPYLWGVNGVTSVVGSVLAAMLSKFVGSSRVILIGGAVYFIAAACVVAFRKRA